MWCGDHDGIDSCLWDNTLQRATPPPDPPSPRFVSPLPARPFALQQAPEATPRTIDGPAGVEAEGLGGFHMASTPVGWAGGALGGSSKKKK